MIVTNKKTYSSGITITRSDPREHRGVFTIGPITIPKGFASSSFTHTTNSTGSVTLPGHNFITGDVFDLYWSGGHRATVTAGVVSGDVVPIVSTPDDLASAGSNLPVNGTAVVASKQVAISALGYYLGHSAVQLLAMQFTGVSGLCYLTPLQNPDFADAPILFTGDELKVYDIELGDSNPFADLITISEGTTFNGIRLSNGSTTDDATFRLIGSANL
jgi:hypothetical protein